MKTKTKYSELDQFTQAYVDAALWSSTDNHTEQGGEPLDSTTDYRKAYKWDDIAAESQARIIHDCKLFQSANSSLWESQPDNVFAPDSYGNTRANAYQQAGHDFWLTRCGHGSGFWETGRWPEDIGAKLTESCKRYGNVDITCHAGKLYFQHPIEYGEPIACKQQRTRWQAAGLQETRTGYGRRLNTGYMIQLAGETKWRRVYAICYSNVASHYVFVGGRRVFLRLSDWHTLPETRKGESNNE